MASRLADSGVSANEREVLVALGEQLTNAEIAARMYVSERTVESHVTALLRKLQVSTRDELAVLAPSSKGLEKLHRLPSRPTPTLTFMFTDIEDSTVLWERCSRVMPEVLGRHDGLLQQVIWRRGGTVFTAGGDGFGAVFVSAPEAAATAVEVQHAVHAEPWPQEARIRVRVGLHSGSATERGGNYFGAVVNRAARVSAAGRGGQIILSAATAELVADEGWRLVDLGLHRLRGLERPERLYRLDAAVVPVVDLPLRASQELAGNLPAGRGRLIGRASELRDLMTLISNEWLVTVTGPGGVGKSRLAVRAAHAIADRFVDGVWLVELAELIEPRDVAPAVATATRLHTGAGDDRAAATAAALAGQRALLLLDNCEHVIEGVVDLVGAIRTQCPHITILATSREVLGVNDEHRLRLEPLDVDGGAAEMSDSARLFCERAASVLGAFRPSEGDRALVETICGRLEGIPLSIELAAARMVTMSLAELHGHLNDQLRVLTRRRGAVARQRSLRATVGWSYDLLTPGEQALFDRLSVFGGEFSFGAAMAVAVESSSGEVEDLLTSLVDKSLVATTRGPLGTRFRQLETLRRYGEERLDIRGETLAARRRHLAYYVAWSEASKLGIRGPDELHWHQSYLAEWSNLRTAVRWACELNDGDSACDLVGNLLWWANSRLRLELAEWCDQALALQSASDHLLRPVLLAGAALFAHERNDTDGQDRLLTLAREENDRLGSNIEPWVSFAVANRWPGGPAAALENGSELLRQAHAKNDPFWELTAMLLLAELKATLIRVGGLSSEVETRYLDQIRETLARAEEFAQPSAVASASAALGLAIRDSDPMAALALLERSLDLCAPLEVHLASSARAQLTSHYTQLGRPCDGVVLMYPDLAHYVRLGAWHEVWPAIAQVAQALSDLGHNRCAATMLGFLRTLSTDLGESYYRLRLLEAQLRDQLDGAEFVDAMDHGSRLTIAEAAELLLQEMADFIEPRAQTVSP